MQFNLLRKENLANCHPNTDYRYNYYIHNENSDSVISEKLGAIATYVLTQKQQVISTKKSQNHLALNNTNENKAIEKRYSYDCLGCKDIFIDMMITILTPTTA